MEYLRLCEICRRPVKFHKPSDKDFVVHFECALGNIPVKLELSRAVPAGR